MTVQGHCAKGFESVRSAFIENFTERGEVGAAVAVYIRGEPVIDLWGGMADLTSQRPWERNTRACMMSVAKGVTALVVHRLVGELQLDMDRPIASYWPTFGINGKDEITLRQVLSHTAGVPFVEGVARGGLYDWQLMTDALARQTPAFAPGTVRCYHSATMGFIAGEVVRRLTDCTLGDMVAQMCGRLDVDYRIGLSNAELADCATMIPSTGNVLDIAKSQPNSLFGKMWFPIGEDEDFNTHAWRTSEIPSANGHGTARGIAKLYSTVASTLAYGSPGPIEPKALRAGIAEKWGGREHSTGLNWRQALGFFLNWPPNRPMGPNPATFGHSGAGGAQSFGDPDSGLGFCYAPNLMHSGIDIGPRATPLIFATFDAIAKLPSSHTY